MLSSDSEEFFDAVDDDAVATLSRPSKSGSFALGDNPLTQIRLTQSLTRKSFIGKFTNTTLSDMSTGSSGGFQGSEAMSESKTEERSRATVTKAHKKAVREFEGLVLAQEVRVSNSVALWTAKFSPDGMLLALGGEEGIVRVYRVDPSHSGSATQPLFVPLPHQVFRGHTKGVLDVSWSPSSSFLLSCGSDCQAVLWQMDSPASLVKFPHPEVVSAVAFNPHNANFFATGSFDRIIRVWNIPSVKVDAYYQASDLIVTVAYSPSARSLLVGLKQGQVLIYSSSLSDAKLKFSSELACRNRRGPKSRGRKVTGFDFFDESTFLVSTNDSRLRLYSDLSMRQKYKGHKAEHGPFRATFSHNLVHVISGSETGTVYIWNAYNTFASTSKSKKATQRNDRFESFRASLQPGASVYCAVFAPGRVLRDLQERAVRHSLSEIISHVIVTAGSEGVLRVFFNPHTRS